MKTGFAPRYFIGLTVAAKVKVGHNTTSDLFTFNKIKSVELCEPHNYYLEFKDTKYVLCVDRTCVDLDRTCPNQYKKYKLYPYFGGQETSPHDIKIRIK